MTCLSPAKAGLHRSEWCEIGAGFVGRESSPSGTGFSSFRSEERVRLAGLVLHRSQRCKIGAGFAGREFLPSGTDTDLKRAQS